MENLRLNDSSSESEQLSKLTPDTITEILLRLPVKPLARFKCVSKTWFSLLHTRSFVYRHITRSLSSSSSSGLHVTRFCNSTLFSLDFPALDSTPAKSVQLPFSTRTSAADLVGSCHGLVCISDHPVFAAVYNPTNFTYHVIPFHDRPTRPPESHWVDFGFGFDFFSQDYKLIRVDQPNGPGLAYQAREVHVFSLNGDEWRKLEHGFPHFLAYPKGHGKFSNNCLHWMATVNPPASYDMDSLMTHPGQSDPTVYEYTIVALNLFTETFLEIPTPDFYAGGVKEFPVPSLVAIQKDDDDNSLMVSVEFGPIDSRSVDVWVMKKYGVSESWVKLLTFHHSLARPEVIGRARVVSISSDQRELLMEENDMPVKYIWCDCETGRVREVEYKGSMPGLFSWIGGHPCDFGSVVRVESMVMLRNAGLEHSPKPNHGKSSKKHDINQRKRMNIEPIRDEQAAKEYLEMRRKVCRAPTVMYVKGPPRRN